MQIDINSRNFTLTDAIRDHAERRARFALSGCNDHIRRVVLHLSDINGPRGGVDKRCQIQVVLAGLPDVVTQDTQVDLYTAINRATDRAGRSVVRYIERRKSRLKRQRPPNMDE